MTERGFDLKLLSAIKFIAYSFHDIRICYRVGLRGTKRDVSSASPVTRFFNVFVIMKQVIETAAAHRNHSQTTSF